MRGPGGMYNDRGAFIEPEEPLYPARLEGPAIWIGIVMMYGVPTVIEASRAEDTLYLALASAVGIDANQIGWKQRLIELMGDDNGRKTCPRKFYIKMQEE